MASPYVEWALPLIPVIERWLLRRRRTRDEVDAHDAALTGVEYAATRQPLTLEEFRQLAMVRARSALIDKQRADARRRRPVPASPAGGEDPPVWELTRKLDDWDARLVMMCERLTKEAELLTFDELGVVIHGLYAEDILRSIQREQERLTDRPAAGKVDLPGAVSRRETLSAWDDGPGRRLRAIAELLWYECTAGLRTRSGTLAEVRALPWGSEITLPEGEAAIRWNNLVMPLWVESLGILWGAEKADARLRLLKELHIPLWQSAATESLPVELVRKASGQQDLAPEAAFKSLRQAGMHVVSDGTEMQGWLADQINEVRNRFARSRRAEMLAARAVTTLEDAASWQPFRWYDVPNPGTTVPGRPVAECLLGVATSDARDAAASRALAVFLGVELLSVATPGEARETARRLGLDFLVTFRRTNDAEHVRPNEPRGFAFHVEVIECEGGQRVWESPLELEDHSRGQSTGAHYQSARKTWSKAVTRWRELCLEAGVVPDELPKRDDTMNSQTGFGLSTALSSVTLANLASRKPDSPGLISPNRDMVVSRVARILIDPDALAEHTRQLFNVFRSTSKETNRRFPSHDPLPETVAADLLSGGPPAIGNLQDEDLVGLLLNPVALYDLSDCIDETLPVAWHEPLQTLLASS